MVFPFRVNNYVVDELIDWDRCPEDPIFKLTFPNKDMLLPGHYEILQKMIEDRCSPKQLEQIVKEIHFEMNPHPAGQLEKNTPILDGKFQKGMQHKYRETVLFFPAQGQTCHAYCTFCFRWAQFIGMEDLRIYTKDIDNLISYIRKHPEVTDVLFTGGDPMTMSAGLLERYIRPLLEADIPNLHSIRIGTKSLSYWPYRYLSDKDSDRILSLFREVKQHGKNLAIMAHFNHPREMETEAVQMAIKEIRNTGAQIRTQSPIIAHINDSPAIWARMWKEQVRLGCIPYYMFMVRNTGAKHYFDVTIERAWEIFQKAYSNVSGLARTVRGPSMSADPGKINILGIQEINGEKVFILEFLQSRNHEWTRKPFFARYSKDASWITDLEPAFEKRIFFFENRNPITV